MRGLGTIINALAIVIGGVLGILFKRFLKERYQDTIIKATGFSVVFLGAAGTLSKILTVKPDGTLSTGGSMVMILSLALGALLGELIDLDAQFERFGEWLKHKTGSDGDNQFVNGFVSASLTVSIGAMAVIGSIQDGIYGDHSTLVAKAILDFIIVLIMCAHHGVLHGQGLRVFIYSGGSAARCHDGSCGSAVRLYDGRCAEQSLAGRKYSDFLCGHQSGMAKNHQGGKPAAVPSDCSGADGDFMNRNL